MVGNVDSEAVATVVPAKLVVPQGKLVAPEHKSLDGAGGGKLDIKEISSIAAGGLEPKDPSFCHVKIKFLVVPANAAGKVKVTFCHVVFELYGPPTKTAVPHAVVEDAGVPEAGAAVLV